MHAARHSTPARTHNSQSPVRPDAASSATRASSLGAQRQPRCTGLHQSSGLRMDHTSVSFSAWSASAGHRMRTAPAGSASS
eukprot:4021151-Prymnesium_polylepis.1